MRLRSKALKVYYQALSNTSENMKRGQRMHLSIHPTKVGNGLQAAAFTEARIRAVLQEGRHCRLILATGASQFEMLEQLVAAKGINWSKVTVFHLDEYIGLPITHPASFRKYLRERFVERVEGLHAFIEVGGDAADIAQECRRLEALITEAPIDVACVGIGENGHLAFNDPPADFDTDRAYLAVDLAEACRRQQLGEGWFESLQAVPERAITMSIRQIMRASCLVVTVPDVRKAEAVRDTLTCPVGPDHPSTILRKHGDCHLFVDEPAASLLPPSIRKG